MKRGVFMSKEKAGWPAVLLALLMLFCLLPQPVVAADKIKVVLNGKELSFSQDPIIQNGSVMVPFRKILEELGATVQYDANSRQIEAIGQDKGINILFVPGNPHATVTRAGGQEQTVAMSQAAVVLNSSTLVPIRFISETLGNAVAWDPVTRTVTISGQSTSAGTAPSQVVVPQGVFTLKSEAFANNGKIPAAYANTGVKGGSNVSIPLSWSNVPAGTKSFAVLMYDLHPIAGNWVHWAVINIPANTAAVEKGASLTVKMPKGCTELNNTFGTKGYGGPQPPARSGNHQYKVIIYALSTESIDVSASPTVDTFNQAIQGKILGQTETNGFYGI